MGVFVRLPELTLQRQIHWLFKGISLVTVRTPSINPSKAEPWCQILPIDILHKSRGRSCAASYKRLPDAGWLGDGCIFRELGVNCMRCIHNA